MKVKKFNESIEKSVRDNDDELLNELAKLMYDKYRDLLKYFGTHPGEAERDYKRKTEENINFYNDEEAGLKTDYKWAKKIMDIIEPHLKKRK